MENRIGTSIFHLVRFNVTARMSMSLTCNSCNNRDASKVHLRDNQDIIFTIVMVVIILFDGGMCNKVSKPEKRLFSYTRGYSVHGGMMFSTSKDIKYIDG